ncbi:hypothetical protein RJ55_04137 [Drechmeria coniospora]|nr:hypothetical protein RJ55_04137 [Drechmeria coniospora]
MARTQHVAELDESPIRRGDETRRDKMRRHVRWLREASSVRLSFFLHGFVEREAYGMYPNTTALIPCIFFTNS